MACIASGFSAVFSSSPACTTQAAGLRASDAGWKTLTALQSRGRLWWRRPGWVHPVTFPFHPHRFWRSGTIRYRSMVRQARLRSQSTANLAHRPNWLISTLKTIISTKFIVY